MSSRPLSPPTPADTESDLDSTAELPVLDPAEAAAQPVTVAQHGSTDTWVMPPAAREGLDSALAAGEEVRALEARLQTAATSLQAMSAQLEHAQQELAGKAAQLAESRQLLARKAERLREVERARDEALIARVAAEERVAALAGELQRHEATLAEHAARLVETGEARGAAEQRATATAAELTQLRAELSAAAERALQLQRRLDDHDNTQRSVEHEQQRVQAARESRLAGHVMEDLHYERARAMSYFESLQTVEGRRLIAEGLVTDLQHEADTRRGELARLSEQLSGREAAVAERNTDLAQRAARIGGLEQQVSTVNAMLAQRDTQLRESRGETQSLTDTVTRLQGEVGTNAERMRLLEALTEQQRATLAQQQSELEKLHAERSELSTALESAQAGASAASTQVASQESSLGEARTRLAQLEPALATERQRVAQLESELGTVRSEMEDWGGVLRSAQQERDGYQATIGAAEARARAAEGRLAQQRELVSQLQAQSDENAARVRQLETELEVAAESAQRLESEARSRSQQVEDLEKSVQQWRATASGEFRHISTDTAANPVLREAARQLTEAVDSAPAEAGARDGAASLLVYSDGGREIVHVLGRKTSIGRTPDNDLQIDAKYVSRHHAVILVGPAHAIIEDLNSTNGVLINGRRITRHTLSDGDVVAIGRTQYRFALRKGKP